MNFAQLRSLLRRSVPPPPPPVPPRRFASRDTRTHDYGAGRRGWGHDYMCQRIDSTGRTVKAQGWGPSDTRIRRGDYLLLQGTNGSLRYRVTHITYYVDPDDMWNAMLEYDPQEIVP